MTDDSARPGESAPGAASAPGLPTAVDRLFGGTSDRTLICLVKTETVGDRAHLRVGRGMKVSQGFTHSWQLDHWRQDNGCTH
jgi:hypothetical protein